jgi:hypothetical protein
LLRSARNDDGHCHAAVINRSQKRLRGPAVGVPADAGDDGGSTKKTLIFAALAASTLGACGDGKPGGGGTGQQIQIVGSSTVYPFTTAVAEQFQRIHPGMAAIVESTGTGAGLKLFCAGVGDKFLDMTNASSSRRSAPIPARSGS